MKPVDEQGQKPAPGLADSVLTAPLGADGRLRAVRALEATCFFR
jgi:hypothetical protein